MWESFILLGVEDAREAKATNLAPAFLADGNYSLFTPDFQTKEQLEKLSSQAPPTKGHSCAREASTAILDSGSTLAFRLSLY